MLAPLQQQLNEFVLALACDQQSDDCNITDKINSSSRIPAHLALEIYRNNTRGVRINALEAIYKACGSILGSETFRAIAGEYVNSDKYGKADLNLYGETFNQFLKSIIDAGYLHDDYRYLPDLSSLEFMINSSYYADNDPDFDFGLFERAIETAEDIYFQPGNSIGLLASDYPILEIWLSNRGQSGSQVIHSITDVQYLLVYRDTHRPVAASINEAEYRLLEAFGNNRSLQSVIDDIDDIDGDIDVILPNMILNKWIVGVRSDA